MKIRSLNRFSAICEARGVEREAGLLTFPEDSLEVGDYVMISMGNVVSKVSALEAEQAWALYDEMFAQIDSSNQG